MGRLPERAGYSAYGRLAQMTTVRDVFSEQDHAGGDHAERRRTGRDTTSADGTQETHDTLEHRVRNLEQRVETLTAAVRALAEGLEPSPGNGAADGGRGARLAHEILLSRGL
ncbi:hypothetical protein QQM39_10490 [Streptomyces sp. DT2A-34]|uniref:hypothetical protein n=1 Tax=Streptomyces sp. DT2A-34 TaxID=3051182 RepID=UPI00265C5EB0|nr:hypothetical protein [Streptomyces sp. DT2A-34]MDO0911266.1 hypothetical protein [Streptomyces sp. DT2A-34]